MNFRALKILATLLTLIVQGEFSSAWATTFMSGSAAVAYNKYDAEVAGKELLSGNSLVQRYSLAYTATNLRYKGQQRYYDLNLGYDWTDFATKITSQDRNTNINESYGEARYSGAVGYNLANIPLKFTAYINQSLPYSLQTNLNNNSLLSDNLVYAIDNRGTTNSSGALLNFDPSLTNDLFLRGLPRLIVEYSEHSQKTTSVSSRIDNKTRELSVASLSQGSNWLIFRARDYENYLVPDDRLSLKEFQIGHVDYKGNRTWSLLTNWITVSADGRFTTAQSPLYNYDEYDANLMAIATRSQWSARTFMNYNREATRDVQTESVSVPFYIKGLYGRDTNWYMSLSATNGRQQTLASRAFDTASSRIFTVGATTFNNSSFTLSPSIRLETNKSYYGNDFYSIATSLESLSTRRFSNRLSLAGILSWQAQDNGADSTDSRSWTSFLDLNGAFTPNSSISYRLQERVEMGSGLGFLETYRSRYTSYYSAKGGDRVGTYLRNYLSASVQWTPSARFSTSLDGSYEIITATDIPATKGIVLNYRASYQSQEVSLNVNSRYDRLQPSFNPTSQRWVASGEVSYKPNRYNESSLYIGYDVERQGSEDINKLNIRQRYIHNFFTRGGRIRNFATISEEYSYNSADSYALKPNTDGSLSTNHYIMASGRYNPIDKFSLYGSVKYEYNAGFSTTMYYDAGMSADFNLFNARLDYALAKRDSDNRIEKRLTTSVSRSF